MSTPLRIGIAGLGVVGGGTLKILMNQAQMLSDRCGRPLVVTAVSARDKSKDRGVDMANIRWMDNPLDMASDAEIDVVVEVIGGADGIAKELVEQSLKNGKSVVTANKALIAHHGLALAKLAEASGAMLTFEAAVAGGIPIVKGLREGLGANRFTRIAGILNGTCNYILSNMWDTQRDFNEVFKEAQGMGYVEADPSLDIDGIDAAHKLAIIASLAYGMAPAIDAVHAEGISRVTLTDMLFADELGCVIKLLGITTQSDRGVEVRVHPCLIAKDSQLAHINGVTNAVLVEGDAIGTAIFEGPGAGEGPTASSVVADILDIARGLKYNPLTLPASKLADAKIAPMAQLENCYYIRLGVIDQPGVLSAVTDIFKQEKISMRSVIQHSHKPGEMVHLVMTTHQTQEAAMERALKAIETLDSVKEQPYMIRMETL
ncbi:MAG: homoserine dehydrogenase [Rickettsiales bacterium]